MNKKQILSNLNIKSEKIRLINEDKGTAEIFLLTEGLKLAKEKNLDLVQITDKVDPPICKIIDLGKYIYNQEKKAKKARKQIIVGGIKGIRISFKISEHDMKTRANKTKNFLEKGNKVKIEIILKGREKYLDDFWKEKIQKFLEMVENLVEIKIEKEIKKEGQGANLIISKKQII